MQTPTPDSRPSLVLQMWWGDVFATRKGGFGVRCARMAFTAFAASVWLMSALQAAELETVGNWSPHYGGEYESQYGKPDVSVKADSRQIGIDFDFRNGGYYCGAVATVDIAEAKRISFEVFSKSPVQSIQVRLVDATGQVFAKLFEYSDSKRWTKYELNLDQSADQLTHFATSSSADDGVIQFPITKIFFLTIHRPGSDAPASGSFAVRDIDIAK